MAEANIIYWRDIPTQIVAGKGRKAIKRQLANRFMVAVDKAAMNGNASDTDAYLVEWRKAPHPLDDNLATAEAVESLALKFEEDYSNSRLADIARNNGHIPETK